MLWTRIRDLAPPAAGWWVSAFKLLDPDSPEAKVSSEETTTLAERCGHQPASVSSFSLHAIS